MKALLILFVLVYGSTSCQQKQEAITKIKLQYSSAMCKGYCDYTFIINKNFKKVIQTPGKAIPSPELKIKKDTIKLTKTDWQQINQSFILDSIRVLPKINGCPGCDDGSIGSLQIISEKDTISIKFEGPDPPNSIVPLIGLITKGTFTN
ncbi:hypothetical protein [Marixanthomonas ophiurae]|uniref:Uncharacterized protein n=1 Tax=Marixanthomonas ophiurae TaxID=387659 RepID=A0A3E1Q681_9FLAO|nr:hypothetical protein [Marixanthomonas ophiurae]RFN57638.1 hypothetical protein DZ858_10310 [Marixanthomonas ophiurae]